MPSPTALVRAGLGAEQIAERLLGGLGSREITRSKPEFHCGCARDRVLRAVALLGRDEVRDLRARRETVDVRCEFCGAEYHVDPEELGPLSPDA